MGLIYGIENLSIMESITTMLLLRPLWYFKTYFLFSTENHFLLSIFLFDAEKWQKTISWCKTVYEIMYQHLISMEHWFIVLREICINVCEIIKHKTYNVISKVTKRLISLLFCYLITNNMNSLLSCQQVI